ncbi:MAG: hypothetical protein ACREX3_12225, partial [Gammaproteobacteria bacterium]
ADESAPPAVQVFEPVEKILMHDIIIGLFINRMSSLVQTQLDPTEMKHYPTIRRLFCLAWLPVRRPVGSVRSRKPWRGRFVHIHWAVLRS